MPDINYPYLEEGTSFDANSLNSRFSTVTDGVNDLMDYSAIRGTFHEEHLPSMVPGLGVPLIASVPTGVFYQTEYIAFDSDVGWEVIVSGDTLQVTFASISLGMSQPSNIAGLYVLMNSQWQAAQPLDELGSIWAAFCIQWSDDLVTWNTISRTERFLSGQGLAVGDLPLPGATLDTHFPDQYAYQDIAIRTLILPADIAPGTTIRGVRGVVSWFDDFAPAPAANNGVVVNASSLSVIPLHAKEMP